MSVIELRKELHHYIDLIEDEEELLILSDAAGAYLSIKPDVIDLLTPSQLGRLDDSIKQADRGDFISHEEALQKSAFFYRSL